MIQRTILFLLSCVFLTIGSSESFAEGEVGDGSSITRTCKAVYEIQPPAGSPFTTSEFFGRGTCHSRLHANSCRRMAAEKLWDCIFKHKGNRFVNSKPYQCTEANSVFNYPLTNWSQDLRRFICNHMRTSNLISVKIKAKSYGDKGCGRYGLDKSREYTFFNDYRIDCSEYFASSETLPVIRYTNEPQNITEEPHGIRPPINPGQVTLAIAPTIVSPTAGQVFKNKEPVRVMVTLPQGIDNKFITLQFQYREDGGQVRGNWRNINQFMPGTAGRYIDFPYSFFKSTGKGDYRVRATRQGIRNAPWSNFVTFKIR